MPWRAKGSEGRGPLEGMGATGLCGEHRSSAGRPCSRQAPLILLALGKDSSSAPGGRSTSASTSCSSWTIFLRAFL